MKFLVQFVNEYHEFRLPELDSVAKVMNVKISYNANELLPNVIYIVQVFLMVDFPSEQDAIRVVSRTVLVKQIFDVFGYGKTYEELFQDVSKLSKEKQEKYLNANTTFKFVVNSFGREYSLSEQRKIIASLDPIFHLFKGKVQLKNPQYQFHIIEDIGLYKDITEEKFKIQRVWIARFVSKSGRRLIHKYDLRKRKYLGTTSMDATLSMLVANQALATPKSFILDPFVGTGSILIACAHFGAHVMGFDIDILVLRGKEGKNLWTNFDQYELNKSLLVDLVRSDMAQNYCWRFNETFDAIVGDPPYGIRAGARKIGSKKKMDKIDEKFKETRIPKRIHYGMKEMFDDLLNFAARALRVGGRLCYWFPTGPQFKESDLPTHECLKLISNSCDYYSLKKHRRLITMEKIKNPTKKHTLNSNEQKTKS